MKLGADGISFSIKDKEILSKVSLSAAPGELVGLIGPNGAGKSTLLSVLAGLNKPDAGAVQLGDEDLLSMKAEERARVLAYLPQKRDVHWPIIVRDLVALGRLPFGDSFSRMNSGDIEAVNAAMAQTDTERYADRVATTLSGGELARVLLARALAQTPHILLADEPTAGLDPAHKLRVLELLRAAAARGMSVVAVLHDLSLAARFCDRLVLLHNGESYVAGTVGEVLTENTIRDVYGVEALITEVGGVMDITAVKVISNEWTNDGL